MPRLRLPEWIVLATISNCDPTCGGFPSKSIWEAEDDPHNSIGVYFAAAGMPYPKPDEIDAVVASLVGRGLVREIFEVGLHPTEERPGLVLTKAGEVALGAERRPRMTIVQRRRGLEWSADWVRHQAQPVLPFKLSVPRNLPAGWWPQPGVDLAVKDAVSLTYSGGDFDHAIVTQAVSLLPDADLIRGRQRLVADQRVLWLEREVTSFWSQITVQWAGEGHETRLTFNRIKGTTTADPHPTPVSLSPGDRRACLRLVKATIIGIERRLPTS